MNCLIRNFSEKSQKKIVAFSYCVGQRQYSTKNKIKADLPELVENDEVEKHEISIKKSMTIHYITTEVGGFDDSSENITSKK